MGINVVVSSWVGLPALMRAVSRRWTWGDLDRGITVGVGLGTDSECPIACRAIRGGVMVGTLESGKMLYCCTSDVELLSGWLVIF